MELVFALIMKRNCFYLKHTLTCGRGRDYRLHKTHLIRKKNCKVSISTLNARKDIVIITFTRAFVFIAQTLCMHACLFTLVCLSVTVSSVVVRFFCNAAPNSIIKEVCRLRKKEKTACELWPGWKGRGQGLRQPGSCIGCLGGG